MKKKSQYKKKLFKRQNLITFKETPKKKKRKKISKVDTSCPMDFDPERVEISKILPENANLSPNDKERILRYYKNSLQKAIKHVQSKSN